MKGVLEHVTHVLEASSPEAKLLLFGHHQSVLDKFDAELRKKVKQLGRFVRIDGKTPKDSRQAQVELFQKDSGVRVALLSICAAGVGLTLTAASLVVFAELNWNSAFLLQARHFLASPSFADLC